MATFSFNLNAANTTRVVNAMTQYLNQGPPIPNPPVIATQADVETWLKTIVKQFIIDQETKKAIAAAAAAIDTNIS